MFKKGFTLIELLAVIVILAIIALIATPRIMDAIEEARKGAFRSMAYNMVRALETDYMERMVNDNEHSLITYEFNDDVQTVDPEVVNNLNFRGQGPKNGYLNVNDSGETAMNINNDKYCAVKDFSYSEIFFGELHDGECILEGGIIIERPECEDTDESYFTFDSETGTITDYSEEGPKDVCIPSEIGGVEVTRIAAGNFSWPNCSGSLCGKELTSVIMPDTLIEIDDYAFAANELEMIYISKNVERIGDSSFYDNNLESIVIPSKLTFLEPWSFCFNSIETVILPNGLERIGDGALSLNNISEIILPESLTDIDSFAFEDNNIQSVEIPGSVSHIGAYSFQNNMIDLLTLNEGLSSIGGMAFDGNLVTSVELPSTLETIDPRAFNYNRLNEVTFRRNDTSRVGFNAFLYNGAEGNSTAGNINANAAGQFLEMNLHGRWQLNEDETLWIRDFEELPSDWIDNGYPTIVDVGPDHDENISEVPAGFIPIYDADDLNDVRDDLSSNYILMDNIDLSDYENWVPIGVTGTYSNDPFTGIFDGNNYEISGLNTNNHSGQWTNNAGLFGTLENAEIRNLIIDYAYVYGFERVGGVAGFARHSTLTNVTFTGYVGGEYYIGGLLGEMSYVTLSNVATHGMVYAGDSYAGGLVGMAEAWIDHTIEDRPQYIYDSYSTMLVHADVEASGGLVGYFDGKIERSFAQGIIYAGGWGSGGLVGWAYQGSIINSYSTSDVYGGAASEGVGGIVGINGQVATTSSNPHGAPLNIETSYAAGRIRGGTRVGGIIGDSTGLTYHVNVDPTSQFATISSSFFSYELAELAAGEYGIPTSELTNLNTFEDYDFSLVWSLN